MSGKRLAAQGIPLTLTPTGAVPVCWTNEPDRLEAGPTGGTGFQPVAVRWEALEGGAEILFPTDCSGQ